jgi:hypothetical protein
VVERGGLTCSKENWVSFSEAHAWESRQRVPKYTTKGRDGVIAPALSTKAKRQWVRGDCIKVGESEVADSAGNKARKSVESCWISHTWVRSKIKGIREVEVLMDGKQAN